MEVLCQIFESEAGIFIARARQREINKTKQNCLYVDVDSWLEVIADPANISEETAKYYLRMARRFIGIPVDA